MKGEGIQNQGISLSPQSRLPGPHLCGVGPPLALPLAARDAAPPARGGSPQLGGYVKIGPGQSLLGHLQGQWREKMETLLVLCLVNKTVGGVGDARQFWLICPSCSLVEAGRWVTDAGHSP